MIRKAQKEDYKQVEIIMQQVQGMHVAWRPDVYRAVSPVMPQAYFLELVEKEQMLVYVEDGVVVGLAIFLERVVSGGPKVTKKTLFVDSLAVLEGHRSGGIGSSLMRQMETIARNRNCDGIELQVNAENKKAMDFYKNCGFREKSINMEICF